MKLSQAHRDIEASNLEFSLDLYEHHVAANKDYRLNPVNYKDTFYSGYQKAGCEVFSMAHIKVNVVY